MTLTYVDAPGSRGQGHPPRVVVQPSVLAAQPIAVPVDLLCEPWVSDSRPDLANIYLHARYYDSALGIFLSPDPIGADRNTYRYSAGDPINLKDAENPTISASRMGWMGRARRVVGAIQITFKNSLRCGAKSMRRLGA